MSLFRKKSDIPEEQALLAAMDDMRKRPRDEPGIEDVRDPRANDDLIDEADEMDDEDHSDERTPAASNPSNDSSPMLDFGSMRIPAASSLASCKARRPSSKAGRADSSGRTALWSPRSVTHPAVAGGLSVALFMTTPEPGGRACPCYPRPTSRSRPPRSQLLAYQKSRWPPGAPG